MSSTTSAHGSAGATAPASTVSGPTATAAAELEKLILATDVIVEFLTELVHSAAAAAPGELSCGIAIRGDHGPMTIASSDTRAAQVDEVQHRQHSGPCLDSLASGHMVVVTDLARDGRWDGYRTCALAHGIRSSLSMPVNGDGHFRGALNLYSGRPHTFGSREQLAAGRFADEARRSLTLAVRIADRAVMSEQLRRALATRTVIDWAIGLSMGQHRCSAEEAFAVLRIRARGGTTLHTVATQLIEKSAASVPRPRSGSPDRDDEDRTGRCPSSKTSTRSPSAVPDPRRLAATIEFARWMQDDARRAVDQARRMRANNAAMRRRIQQARTIDPSTDPSNRPPKTRPQ